MLKIISIEKNEDSTDGNVYMVSTAKTKYVAKVYDDLKHAKSMIKFHSDLSDNGLYVPKILKNNKNEECTKLIDGKHIVIYSFLEGKEIGDVFKNIDEKIAAEIALQLKKIHEITRGPNKYELKDIPFNIGDNLERLSALHFDLTRCNIFYNKNGNCKIGFIDFDDAKYGPSICDVAITAANLFFSKSRGVDEKGLLAFINTYYDGQPALKVKELPFIKKTAIKWINHIMDGNEFDTSTTESFQARKELIEQNMDINIEN